MAAWISLIPSLIKLVYELIKLLSKLKSSDTQVSECNIALRKASEAGDVADLKNIIARLEKSGGKSCRP